MNCQDIRSYALAISSLKITLLLLLKVANKLLSEDNVIRSRTTTHKTLKFEPGEAYLVIYSSGVSKFFCGHMCIS